MTNHLRVTSLCVLALLAASCDCGRQGGLGRSEGEIGVVWISETGLVKVDRDAVYDFGIKDPHFVLGPKIPEANEYHTLIASETQKLLSNEQSAEETAKSLQTQLDELNQA